MMSLCLLSSAYWVLDTLRMAYEHPSSLDPLLVTLSPSPTALSEQRVHRRSASQKYYLGKAQSVDPFRRRRIQGQCNSLFPGPRETFWFRIFPGSTSKKRTWQPKSSGFLTEEPMPTTYSTCSVWVFLTKSAKRSTCVNK